MAYRTIFRHFRKPFAIYRNMQKVVTMRNVPNILANPNVRLRDLNLNFGKTTKSTGFGLALSLLGWLGFTKDDEDKDSELIMILKRAILCKNREQFDTAEQMLHLALRLAQQQQNQQGVIYCYDLMANVAFESFQLDKAEKLFVTVLQHLLGDGMKPDDLKVIHISLKLARIAQLKAEMDKAEIGYKWCLQQIENRNKDENELDSLMLYGVIKDWYAQFLLDKGDVKNSLAYLKEAYEICQRTKGENCELSMLLLNDLGTTYFRAGDLEQAVAFLKEAIIVGEQLEDKTHMGVVHANLGLILLERGVSEEAKKYCKEAWKLGKKHDNDESVQHANYCFDQIKLLLGHK